MKNLCITIMISAMLVGVNPSLNLEQVNDIVKSPKEIGDWIKEHISYVIDPEDIWQSSEETLKNQYGDCEDFAIVAKDVLAKKGIKANILHLAWTDDTKIYKGHAICIFKENGKYSYISTERYQATQKDTIEEVCRYSIARYTSNPNYKIFYTKVYTEQELQQKIKDDLKKDRSTIIKKKFQIRRVQ